MEKKRTRGNIFLIIFFIVLVVFLININFVSLVSAEELSLKITGTINNLTSDIYLKTNSNANTATDSYDMFVKDLPSGDYASFYSNVSSSQLSIDSWNWLAERIMNLIFQTSSPVTGAVTYSWVALTGSYDATFMDYGSDASYTTAVGSANMRTSTSYTTTMTNADKNYVKVVITSYTAPVTSPDTGGSSGGGGSGTAASVNKLLIDNTDLEVLLVVNTIKTRTITITNPGTSKVSVSLRSSGLEKILEIGETSFSLNAGEKKEVQLKFMGPEKPGIYVGKVFINGQEVSISISVSTKEVLFDAGIVVPDEFKVIDVGNKLSSQITLIPMAENPRMDITLNYVIKDFEGRTFLKESETFLIESQKTFKKDFATQVLPAGNYVLGMELIYPNGVATSSSHFKIQQEKPSNNNYIILMIIFGVGIVILILLIILVLRRYSRDVKKLRMKGKRKQ